MKRSAIYARFSTDLQNEKSIDDQILVCRAYAEHHDMTVVETYADRAKSGSSTLDRYDFQKLMRDAEARKFETIIVEDIDRISRDQADFHHVRKMLAFLDIDIHGVHTGRISAIEGSMRAMMGEFFIENLPHKIRRGLVGQSRVEITPGALSTAIARCPGDRVNRWWSMRRPLSSVAYSPNIFQVARRARLRNA